MNKALVIYDNTGKIWSIVYGAKEAPQGLQSMYVDIPQNAILDRIDMETGDPVFTYLPETDLGQLQQEVKQLGGNVESMRESFEETGKLVTPVYAAAKISAMSFTDKQALMCMDLYDDWETYIGKSLDKGARVRHEERLFKVRQDIPEVLENQPPSIETAALYEEICEDHEGTENDPIPYNNNMELFEGKYYLQGGVIYHCIRSTGQAVYNPLSELVDIYVEIVDR